MRQTTLMTRREHQPVDQQPPFDDFIIRADISNLSSARISLYAITLVPDARPDYMMNWDCTGSGSPVEANYG
jgi:hypothetical protein